LLLLLLFTSILFIMPHCHCTGSSPWCLKAVDKIHSNFLWRGSKEANEGHCLITWPKVRRPKELGGQGILDLQRFSGALRVYWLC